MSEGTRTPNAPVKNKTWLHSEPARRSIQRLTQPVTSQADRIITTALRDIDERVRQALEFSSDSESEPELHSNIIAKREFSFDIDDSLLPEAIGTALEENPRNKRHRLPSESSISNVSERGEFSLTSYDSDIFTPEIMERATAPNVQDVGPEAIDREIERMRTGLSEHADVSIRPGSNRATDNDRESASELTLIRVLFRKLDSLTDQVKDLNDKVNNMPVTHNTTSNPSQRGTEVWNRTENRDNFFSNTNAHLEESVDCDALITEHNRKRIKEARDLIPTFDGSSEEKLKEFLNACSYAYKIILPSEEIALTTAIKCTKLKGQAMTELENTRIETYRQLRTALETCYSQKKSITRLQREFNFLCQKNGEDSRTFGQRVEKLSTELFDASIDGKEYTASEKRIIYDHIKSQALTNYQIGLNEKLQTIVRSRAPTTLAEAIAGAMEEERVKGAQGLYRDTGSTYRPRTATYTNYQYKDDRVIKCLKCGKLGHNGRDCRNSRYAGKFPPQRPDRPNINSMDKVCTHCNRNGHTHNECWSAPRKIFLNTNNNEYNNTRVNSYENKRGTNTNITSEKPETSKTATSNKTKTARDFNVNQVNKRKPTGLDLVALPIKEAKKGEIPLLFDTGSAISFIKVRTLKDETPIIEEQLELTGITGHRMHTLGKFIATIKLGRRSLKHEFYIIHNNFPIDYEGIIGIDFLKANKAKCNYDNKQLKIAGNTLKLLPYRTYQLPARSETFIKAHTGKNTIGIVNAEETRPGILIANCLVKAIENTCTVSVINTTDNEIKITTPYVELEELPNEDVEKIYAIVKTVDNDKIIKSRSNKLKEQLRLNHLNTEEVKAIHGICDEFSDTFFLEGDQLSYTKAIEHKITTRTDASSVNIKPYRLPEKHKEEVNKQVQEMLKNNIIRHSTSQWNAPLLVVPKKPDASGKAKLRVVIDFRKLNDLTIGDSFPLPNISDILDQLGNAKYFTTLDLASGYHQIAMSEQDRDKTAFSTPTGHYEFNRMPFGLKNAPATFQRLMNTVLTGLQGIKCLVYLDDIVIYGSSLQDHNKKLTEILTRLRQHNLKLQPDKCEFLRKEVTYLGHIISENGILPDPSKLEAIHKFPTPKKVKDIQSFIGLAGYYRRFIANFSKIARPLTRLTKKEETFRWEDEQQTAFDELKEKLTTTPVLKYPDFTEEFIITTDASDYAIGAILSQGEIGRDNPIAYASRILNRAEQNYNTTEKELLAIVWAVKHFRPYVYGTKFKIITDHKPLVWLFNVTDPGSRLIRWRLKLEEYDYEIIHKAGKANTNADALSRNVTQPTMQVSTNSYKDSTDSEEEYDTNVEEQEKEKIHEKDYTEEEKNKILYEYHNAPLGGHQGVQRTLRRIQLTHKWKNMKDDITKYINKCEQCQKNKLSRKNKLPMVITDTPHNTMEKCALDIVGPLTMTEMGNKYILTFQDNLTKFSKAIPIPDQEASTIAKEFVEKIILEYGIPEKVLTDQGTNFLSNIFKQTCKLLRIEKIQTTAYHPQSNGALERSHRTFAEYLRHYINEEQTDWDNWMPYATFTYNTTPHTSTNHTPFELMYGRQATLPSALTQAPKFAYTYENYVEEMKQRLRTANNTAREKLKQEKEKSKKYYDKKTKNVGFHVGDKVLLYDETVRRGRSKKLDATWIGPYEITKKYSDVNYKIKKGRRELTVHANRIKLYVEN